MARHSGESRKLRRVYAVLRARYGPQRWWPARTGFEMTVGAILTQSTSWSGASRAVRSLRGRGLLKPERIASLPPARLAALIRPAGYPNVKSERLRGWSRFLLDECGGTVRGLSRYRGEALRTRLLGVRGIGPETADCILVYAAARRAFVADAYSRRLFSRLGGLPSRGSYEDVRRAVMESLSDWPVRKWNEFHALIVEHGKRHCRARPVCEGCPLRRDCATGRPRGRVN